MPRLRGLLFSRDNKFLLAADNDGTNPIALTNAGEATAVAFQALATTGGKVEVDRISLWLARRQYGMLRALHDSVAFLLGLDSY